MRSALACDGVLQIDNDFIYRTIWVSGDLTYWPSITWDGRNVEGLVESVRRDSVRVGHVRQTHPMSNRFIVVNPPVVNPPDRSHDKQARYSHDKCEADQ